MDGYPSSADRERGGLVSRRRPRHLKLAEGDQGHEGNALLDGGVTLDSSPPDEPAWQHVFPSPRGDADGRGRAQRLRRSCRAEWRRVAPALENLGLTSSVDLAVLERHATTYALYRECQRDIALRGVIVRTERGAVRNPSVIVLKQLAEILGKTETKLGLTPLDRDALGTHGIAGSSVVRVDDGEAANPFAG